MVRQSEVRPPPANSAGLFQVRQGPLERGLVRPPRDLRPQCFAQDSRPQRVLPVEGCERLLGSYQEAVPGFPFRKPSPVARAVTHRAAVRDQFFQRRTRRASVHPEVPCHLGRRAPGGARRGKPGQSSQHRIVGLQRPDRRQHVRPVATVLGRLRVQHNAAANGLYRGVTPHHEPIPPGRHSWRLESELNQLRLTGVQLVGLQQDYACEDLSGPQM